jgi:hypothetical protein
VTANLEVSTNWGDSQLQQNLAWIHERPAPGVPALPKPESETSNNGIRQVKKTEYKTGKKSLIAIFDTWDANIGTKETCTTSSENGMSTFKATGSSDCSSKRTRKRNARQHGTGSKRTSPR